MSDLYDVEEADQEAAERLRVHEWAAEHQNPLTAALQRAETAERCAQTLQKQRDDAMRVLVAIVDLADAPSVRFGDVIDAGKTLLARTALAEQRVATIRDETLREVEAHGQFVYDYEELLDSVTSAKVDRIVARRRLVMDTGGERS